VYTVSVRRTFIAQHYLTVPNPGPEGELHSHRFTLEVELSGPDLDEYEYLVDIDDVKAGMDGVVDRFSDATLNHQPSFEGKNPSVERFARIVSEQFREAVDLSNPEHLSVRLWEDDVAWASYETDL
jgi:6-pyruvoyltetrahydropterin/6-carboxytetrahydropterin synthase